MGWYYGGFPPYVSVEKRKKEAIREITKLKNKGKLIQPILIEGKAIAKTFWGKSWCQHLESYSDYANRLPRGRSYVRHGAVIDLQVKPGEIKALVKGSSVYKINIRITPVLRSQWSHLIKECSGKIDSLIELLLGKFSKNVMEIITHPKKGLFPHPNEIKLNCSCPDWAELCKHVAAVLYGVGARFDERPEDLFLLRQANHLELIAKAPQTRLAKAGSQEAAFKETDLSALFGINIEQSPRKTINQKSLRKNENPPNKIKSKKLTIAKRKNNVPKNSSVSKTVKKAAKSRKKVSASRQSSLTSSKNKAVLKRVKQRNN